MGRMDTRVRRSLAGDTRMTTHVVAGDQKSAAYREGRAARCRGVSDVTCQYPRGKGNNAQRVDWFNGYLDERFSHITGL